MLSWCVCAETCVQLEFEMAQTHAFASAPAEGNLHVKMAAHGLPGCDVTIEFQNPISPSVCWAFMCFYGDKGNYQDAYQGAHDSWVTG